MDGTDNIFGDRNDSSFTTDDSFEERLDRFFDRENGSVGNNGRQNFGNDIVDRNQHESFGSSDFAVKDENPFKNNNGHSELNGKDELSNQGRNYRSFEMDEELEKRLDTFFDRGNHPVETNVGQSNSNNPLQEILSSREKYTQSTESDPWGYRQQRSSTTTDDSLPVRDGWEKTILREGI